jgi:cysteine-rich repeat protein
LIDLELDPVLVANFNPWEWYDVYPGEPTFTFYNTPDFYLDIDLYVSQGLRFFALSLKDKGPEGQYRVFLTRYLWNDNSFTKISLFTTQISAELTSSNIGIYFDENKNLRGNSDNNNVNGLLRVSFSQQSEIPELMVYNEKGAVFVSLIYSQTTPRVYKHNYVNEKNVKSASVVSTDTQNQNRIKALVVSLTSHSIIISSCASACGNGLYEPNLFESCDDGNQENHDGCSSECKIENSYTCQTDANGKSICQGCGNGKIEGNEECDIPALLGNQGCSSECKIEAGFVCDNTQSPSRCNPKCGDGVIIHPETCDDGNSGSDDGCSSICTIETGWRCESSAGLPSTCCQTPCSCLVSDWSDFSQCPVTCGTGIQTKTRSVLRAADIGGAPCQALTEEKSCTFPPCRKCSDEPTQGKECFDTNYEDGDGCSSQCKIEEGYTCTGNPSVCKNCGNGKVEGDEQCDIGDKDAFFRGCFTCQIEYGWTCKTNQDKSSTCAVCGNGSKHDIEECDDGNTKNNDGCSYPTCKVEAGYTCGTVNVPDGLKSVCYLCGNGKVEGSEKCDDGGKNNGDGCSSTCTIEPGYICSNSAGQPSICLFCGDGIKGITEACDDGNSDNGDGCSSTCTIELGYTCSTSAGQRSICEKCGNGKVEGSEKCDDGGFVTGDGCSSSCTIETGYTCSIGAGGRSLCTKCGDGIKGITEACDDGNLGNGDGCSSTCKIEYGYTCNVDSANKSVCFVCGNGRKDESEQCDDGNSNNGDGCSSTCTIEFGYTCPVIDRLSICASTPTTCGNGKVEAGEACDDGARNNDDGCSSNCNIEYGYICTAAPRSPSVCFSVCGDGRVSNNEECDDGNAVDGDGCSSECKKETGFVCSSNVKSKSVCTSTCGDKIKTNNEECDVFGDPSAGCVSCKIQPNWTCKKDGTGSACSPTCGDGVRISPEECDDGNVLDGDGCSLTCQKEQGFNCNTNTNPSTCTPICGDFVTKGNEQCDGFTGCDSNCKALPGWTCIKTQFGPQCLQPGTENCQLRAPNSNPCDDQNRVFGDGCYDCKTESGFVCNNANVPSICSPVCGDGIIVGTEECDNNAAKYACDNCRLKPGYIYFKKDETFMYLCGGKTLVARAFCDDNNNIDGDGCSSCTIDPGYKCITDQICTKCGNGKLEYGESCDDGNTLSGDGCSNTCSVEEKFTCTKTSPSVCSVSVKITLTVPCSQLDEDKKKEIAVATLRRLNQKVTVSSIISVECESAPTRRFRVRQNEENMNVESNIPPGTTDPDGFSGSSDSTGLVSGAQLNDPPPGRFKFYHFYNM